MPIEKKLTKAAKAYELTEKEYAFACLIAMDWDEYSAWYITQNGRGETWTKSSLQREVMAMLEHTRACTKDLIEVRQKKIEKLFASKVKMAGKSDMSSTSMKETQLKELIAAKNNMTAGSRDWLDAQKLIADIAGSKKSEIKKESKTVHYYLPIKCNICSLYNAARQNE